MDDVDGLVVVEATTVDGGVVVVTIGAWLARSTVGAVSSPATSSNTRATSDRAVRV